MAKKKIITREIEDIESELQEMRKQRQLLKAKKESDNQQYVEDLAEQQNDSNKEAETAATELKEAEEAAKLARLQAQLKAERMQMKLDLADDGEENVVEPDLVPLNPGLQDEVPPTISVDEPTNVPMPEPDPVYEQLLSEKVVKESKSDVDLIRKKLKWTKAKDLVTRFRLRFRQLKIIVCNFELSNGHHTTAVLPIVDGGVTYGSNRYVVDDSLKYYHLGYKEWCLDYHEGFSLPVKRKIPVNDLNKVFQETDMGGVSYATNPSTLKTFQVNQVIKSSIQAAGITDFFKQVRLLVIISALASVISVLLLAYSQGYIKAPGG